MKLRDLRRVARVYFQEVQDDSIPISSERSRGISSYGSVGEEEGGQKTI